MPQAPFQEPYEEVLELILGDLSHHVFVHPGLHQIIDPVEVLFLEIGCGRTGTLQASTEGGHQAELGNDLPEDPQVKLIEEVLLVFAILLAEVLGEIDLAKIIIREEPVQVRLDRPHLRFPVVLEPFEDGEKRDLCALLLQKLYDALNGRTHGEPVLTAGEETGQMSGVLHSVGEGEDLALLIRCAVKVRGEDLTHR